MSTGAGCFLSTVGQTWILRASNISQYYIYIYTVYTFQLKGSFPDAKNVFKKM